MFDSDGATSAGCVHELAGIGECDPDVRRPLSCGREEPEVAFADAIGLDFLADSKLFGDRARQFDLILSEDEAYKPAAIES